MLKSLNKLCISIIFLHTEEWYHPENMYIKVDEIREINLWDNCSGQLRIWPIPIFIGIIKPAYEVSGIWWIIFRGIRKNPSRNISDYNKIWYCFVQGKIVIAPVWEASMMTSSNGNIFRVTGHFCGEFTGLRWIPRTKASDPNKRLSKQWWSWWFETPPCPIRRHRNGMYQLIVDWGLNEVMYNYRYIQKIN